ncbi:guanine nucleotide-binding protein alpha-4 subunit [Amanita muscaria]
MLRHRHNSQDDDDPLTKALAPPPDETPEQRDLRLQAEREAQLISEAIDEEINRQRLAEKKEHDCIRILLLGILITGIASSGKSTTLKNFQLFTSPKAFKSERATWRAVVQLNVVRSIHLILDAMEDVKQGHAPPNHDAATGQPIPPVRYPTLTVEHMKLRMRLLPLQRVEELLLRRLSHAGSATFEPNHLVSLEEDQPLQRKEFAVHSSSQWINAFGRLLSAARASFEKESEIDFTDPNDPGVILNACSEDMTKLWNDPIIQQLLRLMRIRLEDMAGFFLDSIDRVTSLHYIPTDDDILRARLKTIGVSEHRFNLNAGKHSALAGGAGELRAFQGNVVSHDWRVFDVGGARSLVSAWAPYFDNMNAIIFLAPISCFDQVLLEDPNVNRLEDSILLWKSVISSPLLKDSEIILFLNKIDILKAKLAAGIQFGQYVISYGNRPNDVEHASNYLKKKFGALHKQYSLKPREFHCHLTTITDVKSTQRILNHVKDMVIRKNLKDSSLV